MRALQKPLVPFLFSFILIVSFALADVNETTTTSTTTTAPTTTSITTTTSTTTSTSITTTSTTTTTTTPTSQGGGGAGGSPGGGETTTTSTTTTTQGDITCQAIFTCPDGLYHNGCSYEQACGTTAPTTTTTTTITNPATDAGSSTGELTAITTTTIPTVTSTVPQVCAQDVKQCSDGGFVGRNPQKNCEFYQCAAESSDKTPPVISALSIAPDKIQIRSEVRIHCKAADEKAMDRTEIIILTPSGKTDIFANVEGRGYFADQQGVYKVLCKARDMSGNVAELTQAFFVYSSSKQSCPGECCTFEDKFEDKFCGAGLKCEKNTCQKIEDHKETIREIPGITTIRQILNAPQKFENAIVKIVGVLEKGKCDITAETVNAVGIKTGVKTAKEIATGKATATKTIAAAQPSKESEKCFPFFINDGTGRIGLIGFGGNMDNRKIELKGVVKTYEISGTAVPILKVEGHSESGPTAEPVETAVRPVFATSDKNQNTEECHRNVRKYAIRLTHNKDVQKVVKDSDDLWNYLDANYQAVISDISANCKEEPEISNDYLMRAIQNEISKNANYGSQNQIAAPSQTTDPNVVPLIIVMRDVSNTHLEDLKKASGLELAGALNVEPLDKLTIIRMPAIRENVDAIRKLEFVEDVKVNSVVLLAGGDVTKTSAPRVSEKLELSKNEILKNLEAIKSLSQKDDEQVSLSASQDAIIQSSDSLQSFDNQTKQRGIGYTLGWLLGAAAAQEKNDASFLNGQVTQLQNTIKTLEGVSAGTDDITIKTSLKEQVEILKTQAESLKKEAETKNKNAGGILALIKNMIGG